MPGFLGRYEFQLDAKGRVSLPAAFRRGVSGNGFVLLQWSVYGDQQIDITERWIEISESARAAEHDPIELRADDLGNGPNNVVEIPLDRGGQSHSRAPNRALGCADLADQWREGTGARRQNATTDR